MDINKVKLFNALSDLDNCEKDIFFVSDVIRILSFTKLFPFIKKYFELSIYVGVPCSPSPILANSLNSRCAQSKMRQITYKILLYLGYNTNEKSKVMKKYNELTRHEQEAYLMLPILTELKKLGGQSTTKDLKRSVVSNDSSIPENTLTDFKTSRKGSKYLPFNFSFNFAIANLILAEMLKRPKTGIVKLTEKGREFEGNGTELSEQVYKISVPLWKDKSKQNQSINDTSNNEEVVAKTDEDSDDEESWRSEILSALMNLSPAKFELFCRALVKRMKVDIDENVGTKLTGDGGLDGYGYITTDDFRTSRVAIQAKRWSTNNSVSSPEIDKFRGAMDKFRAEFGIFITTSTFTRDAIKASRAGTRVITLIDGDKLIDLVTKYELYVKPVTVYKLEDFFREEN